jgi:hypothetical protein
LASLQCLKHQAKYNIKRWCEAQPKDAMCSMTSLFDLLCDNVKADVPDAYFDTLVFWGPHVWDKVMMPCSAIIDLYSKPKTKIGVIEAGEVSSSGSSTSDSWGCSSPPTLLYAHTDPQRLVTTMTGSTRIGKKALLNVSTPSGHLPNLRPETKVAKVLVEEHVDHLPTTPSAPRSHLVKEDHLCAGHSLDLPQTPPKPVNGGRTKRGPNELPSTSPPRLLSTV